MIDVTTQKPFQVEQSSDFPAAVSLPVVQLEDVRKLLDAHGFRYWVSEGYFSFNGGPTTTRIVFSHSVRRDAIQAALDSVA